MKTTKRKRPFAITSLSVVLMFFFLGVPRYIFKPYPDDALDFVISQ